MVQKERSRAEFLNLNSEKTTFLTKLHPTTFKNQNISKYCGFDKHQYQQTIVLEQEKCKMFFLKF